MQPTQPTLSRYQRLHVRRGVNDLATVAPDVAAQWHPTRNGDIAPGDVAAGSHRAVWWLCGVCGHEWTTAVYARSAGRGCPECQVASLTAAGRSLAAAAPALAAEWSAALNGCAADEVSRASNRRAWWECATCGNVWDSVVASRTAGSGCPRCAERRRRAAPRRFVRGVNDLASRRPDVAA